MLYDEEDGEIFQPDVFHFVRREFLTIQRDLEVTRYGIRSVPTHTEDGIPIRKLYVSNLPPKTTRAELFGVFAQYGFIKSCWLRMGEKGPNRAPAPTYAFVTFSSPVDAHKALQAPCHEKTLRGRTLRISPADSWHQPAEDADGRVQWTRRNRTSPDPAQGTTASAGEGNPESTASPQESSSLTQENTMEEETEYNIMDVLNRDCLSHILSYVPIRDLIRSERVSKRWRDVVHDFLQGIRTFKTSWWEHGSVTLTTAVLRHVLHRLGPSLTRLHIDHHWSALNDRTAHTVGKFCPNLEELKVVGMYTKNWNPLLYGCKQLKGLSFLSCNKLTDSSLMPIVNSDANLENLTITNNTHVTGIFLTGQNPRLNSLAFYNCYSLQGPVLAAAIDTLPYLTRLKLDLCPWSVWKAVPDILRKLPNLEELSLSEYTSAEARFTQQSNETFCEALGLLTELKTLSLSRNVFVTNTLLKQVAQACTKLVSLNVSGCNARGTVPCAGVSDEGVSAVSRMCTELRTIDLSYLLGLSNTGLSAVSACSQLTSLTVRGNNVITAQSLVKCIQSCHALKEIDTCGCEGVSPAVVEAACAELTLHPRPLTMYLAGTAASGEREQHRHVLLEVDTKDDRCDPHLRDDIMDRTFDNSSSEDSLDLLSPERYDDLLGSDDDLYLEDELDEYDEAMFQVDWGLHPDFLLS